MARTKGGLSEVPQGIDLKKEPGQIGRAHV